MPPCGMHDTLCAVFLLFVCLGCLCNSLRICACVWHTMPHHHHTLSSRVLCHATLTLSQHSLTHNVLAQTTHSLVHEHARTLGKQEVESRTPGKADRQDLETEHH